MYGNIIKKSYTIVTIAQLIFSFIALFVSSFIWSKGDIYIQLGYNGYGWQTIVIACLCLIWIVNLISSLMQLNGINVFQEYRKLKLLIVYGFCTLLAIIAAALETWNSKLAAYTDDSMLHPRFIIAAVFCWLLIISHAIMIFIVCYNIAT
ncbi:putative integral membrane protein [Acanthocheilonema viteae]